MLFERSKFGPTMTVSGSARCRHKDGGIRRVFVSKQASLARATTEPQPQHGREANTNGQARTRTCSVPALLRAYLSINLSVSIASLKKIQK